MIDLKPLCSTDQTRAHICKPFGVTLDGQAWECATNGHALFARRVDVAPPESSVSTHVADILKPHAASVTVNLAALKEWAGDPTLMHEKPPCPKCKGKPKECPDCDGSGRCTCHCGDRHDCGHCNGGGTIRCPACRGVVTTEEIHRPGRIGGITLDLPLLALYLTPATGETVCVRTAEERNAVQFDGGDWRAAIMPRSFEPGDVPTEFPL